MGCLEMNLAARLDHNYVLVIAKIIECFIVVGDNLRRCEGVALDGGVRITCECDIIAEGSSTAAGGIDAILCSTAGND